MDALFRYLVRYETPIYILLGLGALFAIRSVWLSWHDWRKAVFGLEKEIAYQRFRTRSAVLILIVMILLSQFCMVSFVVPYLPSIVFTFTATPDLLGNNLSGSAILSATPEALELFSAPDATGCTPDEIMITMPEAGQEVKGRISLVGTANVQNFGFYKYEYRQSGSEKWETIVANREIVVDNSLGNWDTSSLLPGDYELRLVVTTGDNKVLPACIVPIRILEP